MQHIQRSTKWVYLATTSLIALSALPFAGSFPPLLSAHFLPHRYCYLAQPALVWINVIMDGIIWASYTAIFLSLFAIARRLRRLSPLSNYLWIFISFGIFFVACGATHIMEAVTVWWPVYPLATVIKTLCAAASLPAAILFARATPLLSRGIAQFLEVLSAAQHDKDDAVEKLTAAEKSLRLALTATNAIGTWEWDVLRDKLRMDEGAALFYGVDAERAERGAPIAVFTKRVHPDDLPRLMEAVNTTVVTRVPFAAEYRVTHPDGSLRWVAARGRCTHGTDGAPLRFHGISIDVTEQKWLEERARVAERAKAEAIEAEAMLRESEESLRLAFTGTNGVGTWQWDLSTDLIRSNPEFARFYGVDPEVARLGASFDVFAANIPREDRDIMRGLVKDAIKNGTEYSMEHRVVQADGSVRWVAARARCKYAPDGRPIQFPGVVIDITDRRRTEEAILATEREKTSAIEALAATQSRAAEERLASANMLAETHSRFRLLVEGVRDHALFTIDDAGLITSWNLGAERLLGYVEEEIVGRSFACFFPKDDVDCGLPSRQIQKARQEGRAEHEGWLVRADGQQFWATISKTALAMSAGSFRSFAVIIQDTTERRKVANILEEARQERLRLQERFLSHVSHELRTPLTAIYFFTSNVADGLLGDLNPEQREQLSMALENVDQLKEMVGDLLDITRATAQKLTVEPQQASPEKLIAEVLSTCRAQAAAKNISLSADFVGDIAYVWADPFRVRQILTNLIENAIKFTPEGGTVTVHRRLATDVGNYLCISVRDTGYGISPENCELIFDRLAQVESRSTASRGGLGLGLFITRELVNQHGGRLWVESEVGYGSTFSFTLPVFSLANMCAHVLTPHNLDCGYVSLIALDIIASENSAELATRLQQIHDAVETCIQPSQDAVLPWMYGLPPTRTLFVLACTGSQGLAVISTRMGRELKNLGDLAMLQPTLTSTTLQLTPGLALERQISEITEKFEQTIQAHLQGKEIYQ